MVLIAALSRTRRGPRCGPTMVSVLADAARHASSACSTELPPGLGRNGRSQRGTSSLGVSRETPAKAAPSGHEHVHPARYQRPTAPAFPFASFDARMAVAPPAGRAPGVSRETRSGGTTPLVPPASKPTAGRQVKGGPPARAFVGRAARGGPAARSAQGVPAARSAPGDGSAPRSPDLCRAGYTRQAGPVRAASLLVPSGCRFTEERPR